MPLTASELCNQCRSLLRYAWAFPATALGLLLASVARAQGATIVIVDGTVEVAGGRLGRAIARMPRLNRFDAITFGHVVAGTSHEVLAACRAHERVHVHQYERWGVLFFPLYLGSSLVQLLRGRSPYWHNHFERQAFRAASGIGDPTDRPARHSGSLATAQGAACARPRNPNHPVTNVLVFVFAVTLCLVNAAVWTFVSELPVMGAAWLLAAVTCFGLQKWNRK